MQEEIHRYKGDYVILRYDKGEKDWRKNGKSEYRTGSEWKPGLKNAKIYWHEDTAAQELVMMRVKKAALSTN